jgi:hypothetical protein
VSGISSPSQGLPTRPPPYVSPDEKAARDQAILEQQHAHAQARLEMQRAQAERDEAERIRPFRRNQKRALAAIRENGPDHLTGAEIIQAAVLFLSTASTAYLGISLSVLLVTGSWSGGFSWMWMCALVVALVIPVTPIVPGWFDFSEGLWLVFIPILISTLHHQEEYTFWGIAPLLIVVTLLYVAVWVMNLFAWQIWEKSCRRERNLLRQNLPCDYCGRPAKHIVITESCFEGGRITVVACWKHGYSTPWTEELEVALLDKTLPPNGQ